MTVAGRYHRAALLTDEVQPARRIPAGLLRIALIAPRPFAHPDIEPTTKRRKDVP